MSHGPRYRLKPRRRREGRTDYRKRLALLRSNETRMVVRKTNKQIIVQFVEYKEGGDRIIAQAVSNELKSGFNWKHSLSNTPSAYLTGILASNRAQEKGVKKCVLDIGRQRPVTGSKVFASLKGALDSGIKCPHSPKKLPKDERISGKHIDEKIAKEVENIKNKISGGK